MSANGTRTIIWAGGEDVFCLAKVGLILELEEKCDAGIAAVMKRLVDNVWKLHDVREPIRLGLIGGGMEPEKAMAAVKRHVDDTPLTSSVLLAYQIIAAVMVGVKDDLVGKGEAAEAATTASSTQTDASAGLN